ETTNRIYTGGQSGALRVIDGVSNAVIATVQTAGAVNGIAVNSLTNRVYVPNYPGTTVSVIDGATNSITGTIAVGNGALGAAVNRTTNRIYVSNYNSA